MTDSFILEIAAHPAKWIFPHRLFEKLPADLGFYFCSRVFAMHDRIPAAVLLKLWCSVILQSDSKQEHFHWNRFISGRENFLIDLRFARKKICREKGTGSRLFRYMDGGRKKLSLIYPSGLLEAMKEDSAEHFMILMNMSGIYPSYSLILDLAENNSLKILSYLFRNSLIPEDIMTMEEFCIMTLASFHGRKCMDLLLMLDGIKENFLRDFRDPFGRNLLWYTMELGDQSFFSPKSEIVSFLLSRKCDPANCNQIGLPWNFLINSIPLEWKLKWMKKNKCCTDTVKDILKDCNSGNQEALNLVSTWDGIMILNRKMSKLRVKKIHAGRKKLLPEISGMLAKTDLFPVSWEKDSRLILQIPRNNTSVMPEPDDQTKAISILKTGMLLYHPLTLEYYCRHSFPGYKNLRHFGGYFLYETPENRIQELLSTDNVAETALICGENPAKCTFGLFDAAIRFHAEKTCEWFLDEASEISSGWNMEELLFHVVSTLEEDDAIHAVSLIEKREENIAERCRDCFGSNLLWYALFNPMLKSFEFNSKHDKQYVMFHNFEQFRRFANSVPKRGLVKYLQHCNCRPSSENVFTLTPEDAAEIQKIRKMKGNECV